MWVVVQERGRWPVASGEVGQAGCDRPLYVVRARPADLVLARWRFRRLDGLLAAGVAPEASRLLAVRAVRLTAPATRCWVARSFERVTEQALRPAGLRPGPVSGARRRVVAQAADDLLALVERLRRSGPVSARGMAAAVVLLSDGVGPLHAGASEAGLRRAVRQVAAHLDDALWVSPGEVGRPETGWERAPRRGGPSR